MKVMVVVISLVLLAVTSLVAYDEWYVPNHCTYITTENRIIRGVADVPMDVYDCDGREVLVREGAG